MGRLTNWFGHKTSVVKNLFRKRIVEENMLSGLDLDLDRLYEDPQVAIEIQQRYMTNVKRIDMLKPNYKKHVSHVTILQRIEMLPKSAKKDLEKMCQIYSETLVQKSEYRDKIQNNTDQGQHEYLEKYEDNMDDVLKMMGGHETNQRLVKQDMAYLEAEKTELIYQSGRLKKAYKFINSAFIVVAIASALAALILSTMYFVYKQHILIPSMVAMIAVITSTVWVYVFRRYLKFELNKNQKLMKRAVELLNKTKIKYINNQKVIDYQCRKYKVDSSEMLALRWENYRARINAKNQYRNISNSIAAMITDVENLLHKNGIEDEGLVLDHLDYFVSKQGRKLLMDKLVERRDELKKEYDQTERENDVINLVLINYKSQMQ